MEVLMQGGSRVPVGCRFMPTDEELLRYYLRRKIRGEELPEVFVHSCDLYGQQEPWDIWEQYKDPSDSKTKNLYFFSRSPRKRFQWNTIRTVVRTGNWKGGKDRKKVHASGSCRIIGWRRSYVYEKLSSDQDGCWAMDELSSKVEERYVLCVLRKIRKRRSRTSN